MPRFYGKIGYVCPVEEPKDSGIYVNKPIERDYSGDFLRNSFEWNRSENLNDDVNISHSISIIADSYALEHLKLLRYVKCFGECWKISKIEIQHPRLILTLGGVYNGESDGSPACSGNNPW